MTNGHLDISKNVNQQTFVYYQAESYSKEGKTGQISKNPYS